MARKTDYKAEDIRVLTDREHVRMRTQVYLGSMNATTYSVPIFTDGKFSVEQLTFIPAVYKAVGEIIDNSIDEFSKINSKTKTLSMTADPLAGHYTIADTGRGIPIDPHPDVKGKFTPEVALSQLRAGRNFTDDKEVGVIGMNGVGAACTNYCSSDFMITIHRDGKQYVQKFVDGANKVSTPKITTTNSKKTGTEISFTLDNSVFSDTSIPPQLVANRAVEIALANPDITVEYNGTKFKFKKGFSEIIEQIANSSLLGETTWFGFTYETESAVMEWYVMFGLHSNVDEQTFTWVNSSYLFDGGICNTQFLNQFYDHVIGHLQSDAKKVKAEITKNDVRQGLTVIGNLRIKNPEYDSQAKTRLVGPNLRKEIGDMLDALWKPFVRKNQKQLDQILERAVVRHHTSANKKAIDEHKKSLKKKVPGLIDATSRFRSECSLVITEGESAAAMITNARDPRTIAVYPLSGKINNVYGMTAAQILQAGKLTDLLKIIGLVPGKKAMRGDLNYGKVIIATDADYDGADIFTLLINLFYQWPELFDGDYEPFIHRLMAPNVCLVKGGKRIHFPTFAEYEKQEHKYKGYETKYYKGLGGMITEDWEMILSGETDTLLPVIDDGNFKPTLHLLFGPDSDIRKEWLQK
jgi:DNA topoisomerase-2